MCGGLSAMTVMIQYWCNSLLTCCADEYTVSTEIFPSDFAAEHKMLLRFLCQAVGHRKSAQIDGFLEE